MIFERITIQNLFSYNGEQTFDIPKASDEKPVVLIAGRNGFGKTSFINSVKLLFLGTSDQMIQNDAQVGRKLTPKTYLLGVDRIWRGVFNQQARSNPQSVYGVKIDWIEESGEVSAHRFWRKINDEFVPHLRITTNFEEDGLGDNGIIDDIEEAEEFLQRRLPRDIVSFFFYDGEKVQNMAEAQQEGLMKNIEKLFGLAAVDVLDDYLKNAIASWKKDGTADKEQAQLDTLTAQLALKNAEKARAKVEADEVEADLENLDRDIRRHERQISNTQLMASQRETPHLKEKLKISLAAYEKLCQRIATNLPATAPLWAAAELVQKVSAQLEVAVGDPSQRLAEEIQSVFSILPNLLFDQPRHPTPVLSDAQKNHYKVKLAAILKQYTETPGGGYYALTAPEIAKLQARMVYFSQARGERQRISDDLREVSQAKREWMQAKADLEAIGGLSPELQQAYRDRQAELDSLVNARNGLYTKRGMHSAKISSIETDLVRLKTEIDQQETRRVKAGINSRHIDRAVQARSVFEEYRTRLKVQRREEIETVLNRCFKKLMTSHQLISHIALSDDFALSYRDESDEEIGIANISAGMKQLSAQALLWALSEISGRNIPVVVDTPLARIDRQHQENLLVNYYPKAAKQVIILPTDSELDFDKYNLLSSFVGSEFKLSNSDGVHTSVESSTKMYEALNGI